MVKSWVWLMTIGFGLVTTTEWRKDTRTQDAVICWLVHHPKWHLEVNSKPSEDHAKTGKASSRQLSLSKVAAAD